jgi:hypothetical protein
MQPMSYHTKDCVSLCIPTPIVVMQWLRKHVPVEKKNCWKRLRFETSRFVAPYDSQGYGGGIRPRLHAGLNRSSLHGCL